MTDNTQGLDATLLHLQRTASELSIVKGLAYKQVSQRRKYQRTRAKQALLYWHNRQTLELLDRLESLNGSHPDSYIATFIEAERAKLKEVK